MGDKFVAPEKPVGLFAKVDFMKSPTFESIFLLLPLKFPFL